MTRVNLVPPEELHRLHLLAEYRELPRVLTLAARASRQSLELAPERYTLGPGHVRFFYSRALFIARRHRLLVREMERRGWQPMYQDLLELLMACPRELRRDWSPSPEEVEISRRRIAERLPR